ncbi:hypothetical protein GCM10009647_024240 [Streptomyces sanglieri]|uniref:Uncharacterized protein n=1 Tax=Streptomyces sanglieri TaxID=193460 RepID=A0ABW2X5X1_9ACTN|nr:hypothetical protein [Streptomyces sp. Wh19]MDV9194215.1 hypothetical protein [Streptomyces sp. Wh19]
MTEQVISLAWRWTAETSSDSTHRFCRILVTAPPGEIGDPDAWSVVGLVQGAIDGMLKKLAPQPVLHAAASMDAATLFAGLHAWHSEGMRPAFAAADADPRSYFALPEATELFDAEDAYLVRSGAAGARLLWCDYTTKEVREVEVDFDACLAGWKAVRDAIRQDGEGSVPPSVDAS